MSKLAVPASILTGILLFFIGAAWNQIIPASAYWSADNAAEFVDAQSNLHAHLDHSEDRPTEFTAAKERFIKIRDELEAARNSRSRLRTVVTVLGAVLLLVGVVMHLSGRQNS